MLKDRPISRAETLATPKIGHYGEHGNIFDTNFHGGEPGLFIVNISGSFHDISIGRKGKSGLDSKYGFSPMVAKRMVILHRMVSGNVKPLGIGSGIHVDIFLYVIMGFHNSNNLVLRFENVRKDLTLCRRPPDGNIAEEEIKLVLQFGKRFTQRGIIGLVYGLSHGGENAAES